MNGKMIHHCEESISTKRQFILRGALVMFYGLLRSLRLLAMMIIAISTLTSCSSYSSKFICPNAKGLNCEMLRSVDHKITTGEIDKFYICKSKKCLKEKL